MKTARHFLLAFIVVALGVCCTPPNPARKKLIEVLEQERKQMPHTVLQGTSVCAVDAFVDEDTMVIVATASAQDCDAFFLSDSLLKSERNIARILSYFDAKIRVLMLNAKVGYKLVVLDDDNGETLRKLYVSPTRLSNILVKMRNGQIAPYSMRELAIMETESMQFPVEAEDGFWIVNAYVEGNDIVFEYIDEELGAEDYDLSPEGIQYLKEGLAANLCNSPTYSVMHLYQQEHLRFVYIFRDKEGNECVRIAIDSNEL